MNDYVFHISKPDILIGVGISIGASLFMLLWFAKLPNRKANRLLGLILLNVLLWLLWELCIDIKLDNYFPQWSRIPMRGVLALGPLIFFYVRAVIHPGTKFSLKNIWHFTPVFFEIIAHVWAVSISIQTGLATDKTAVYKYLNELLPLLSFASVMIYLVASNRIIQRFYQQLKFVEGDRQKNEFRWLQRTLLLVGLCWICWIIIAVADYSYFQQQNTTLYYPWYAFTALLTNCLVVYYLLESVSAISATSPANSKPALSADLRNKASLLKKSMVTEQYYLEPELNLRLLAEKLGQHPNELSRIINTGLKKSFNDFINEYRVAAAIEKMMDPLQDKITLLGIGFDAGFNSKSSFQRIFKEYTGKSPAEYKNNLKNELPNYSLRPGSGRATIISRHKTIATWSYKKLNRIHMFRNYIKIAWRNTLHNKVYSLLNIIGLGSGMAVVLLIGLWVYYQYSYDRFLPGYQRLFQVEMNLTSQQNGTSTQTSIALPLVDVLRKEIPGIKYVVEADNIGKMNHNLLVGDKKLYLGGGAVGPDFFKLFQYPFIKGNRGSVFKDIYSIVLTASTAKALFGESDAMGKFIRFDNQHDMKVTGIIADLPKNATLQFDYLTTFAYTEATQDWIHTARSKWTYNSFSAYVALDEGVPYSQVAPVIRNIVDKRSAEMHSLKPEIFLHPVKDWHLLTDFKNGKAVGGFIEYVRLFSIIGLLVLVIASINFMNLSTARSEKRAREVGVRKAIGSSRLDLVYQFLLESVLITFLSFLLCILFVQLALPWFNTLTNSHVSIPYGSVGFWAAMIGFILFTGVISGSRPAFYLSAFNAVRVLKGRIQVGKWASFPRKVLVVIQFTCSIALIISTAIVYKQIQYIKNRPTGYNAERLVMTDMNGDLYQHYDALRNDMLSSGLAENVASSTSPLTQVYSHFSLQQWPGKNANDEEINIGAIWVSNEYFKTMGMTMLAGREFSGDWRNDSLNVIVNEATIKRLGLKNPVNQLITWNGSDKPVHIIGVVKDALMESPYSAVVPAIFGHNPSGFVITYRLPKNADIHTTIAKIGKLFEKYNPNFPYLYKFVDDEYAQKFNLEVLIGKLAAVFAGLAIFISCLGLFGLAAFVAEQRTKEIGIRKILGASVAQLWMLLSRDFVTLVIISCLVASPLTLYLLSSWLRNYEFHTPIGLEVFIISGMAAIIITLITISYQAIKVALANPVKNLRIE